MDKLSHQYRKFIRIFVALVLCAAFLAVPQGNVYAMPFNPAVNYGVGNTPRSVAVGDFDGDGNLDLAVANNVGYNISILIGNGDGTFRPKVNYPAGDGPLSVAVGDFNSDNKTDLAVANDNGNDVSILLGAGDGTFIAAGDYGVGTFPSSVAVGDFDVDGNLDLAVANGGASNVSILLGAGDGTFIAAGDYGVGSNPLSVAVGDFDVDGNLDLAVANNGSDNVSILLGVGGGTFNDAVNYNVGNSPFSVAVGDFNSDNTTDLAVANYGNDNASILLGNGDGTFNDAVNYGVGTYPTSVAVGDFNGDGKTDPAVANYGSDNVSILLGNGDGTFNDAVNYNVGRWPLSVAVGDFNGDGRPDLAVANVGTNDVSILLNTSAPPPTFVSAATDVTGTTIAITFSKNMANPAGKQTEFSYKIGVGPAQSFSAAALDADNIKIDLTCSGTAIAYGDTVTVSYNMGTVLAADGNVLQSFTDQAVTNNVPGPPTFVSAATNTAGTTITITFSKTMADPTGKQGEFSYKVNGGPAQSFSAAALDADNTRIDLTCSGTAIVYGDIVTVSYNMGTVLAADGNVLQSFTDQAVTNNVQQSSQQVTTATGTGTATFTTSNGAITGLTAAISTPCGILSGFIFPHGFFSFNITNIPAGSTVIITITLPSNMPMGTWYWKCINGQWVDCTSLLGDNNGDNILTLTITDGGLGDADGVANGTIVDPGGPAVVQAAGLEPAARRVLQTLPNWLKPAQMSLQYLNINPQQAYPNQPVTIITNVVNTGDEAGNYNVVLKINGQVEQTKTVSVGRRGTQPVKFTVTESQPGTYAIDIGGQTGSFTIIGAGGSAGAPLNGVLIAVLIIGVLILAAVVVLILKFRRAAKKRKAAQEDTLQIRK